MRHVSNCRSVYAIVRMKAEGKRKKENRYVTSTMMAIIERLRQEGVERSRHKQMMMWPRGLSFPSLSKVLLYSADSLSSQ